MSAPIRTDPLNHSQHLSLEQVTGVTVVRLRSEDGTNRLTRAAVLELVNLFASRAATLKPVVITGNHRFFSAGADLTEIAALNGPVGFEFAKMGQALMRAIECFPAPVVAAVSGYCMGGGLDLALACHRRIAAPNAVFGHRGAALGLITGWGGTQRLPRLIGKGRALQMFLAAEKIDAREALRIGLVSAISEDPVEEALNLLRPSSSC
jgi:enoyl-CoA hydratase/carnithine racemase